MEKENRRTSEKLETIQDLLLKYKKLRNELSGVETQNQQTKTLEAGSGNGATNSFVRRKTKPGMPSMYDPEYKQGGFIQIMMLSFLTLFFEGLFILVSYFIFS